MPKTDAISYKERLILLAFLVFLPFLLILALVIRNSGGEFIYTLDDPYIHLALARNIWLGNYGINLTELSAPSSSIIWPFLLAPFSILQHNFEYIPLIINVSCLTALALVINNIFKDIKFSIRLILTAILLLSLNAYGLVFTGMEHSLQILLVALILLPFLDKTGVIESSYETPNYAIWAIILLPLVRYEGLAISLPMLAYLFIKGERQKAVIAFLFLMMVIVGFSLFLAKNDLGFLPSSVMAKSSHGGISSTLKNLVLNIKVYGFILLPVTLVAIKLWPVNKAFSVVVLTVTALHFLLGKAGWFGRYENYYLLFIVLISIRVIINNEFKFVLAILCLPLMFFSLVVPTLDTAKAASNVHNQQEQMAKIANKLAEPVAVNDLGLVALRSGQYVLDLWGLGSIEALRARLSSNNADWIKALMTKKQVYYAFVFDKWFPQKPENWQKVGEIKLLQQRIIISDDTVGLYATDEAHAEKLVNILKELSLQQNSSDKFSIKLM